jgi:hypothetical protein
VGGFGGKISLAVILESGGRDEFGVGSSSTATLKWPGKAGPTILDRSSVSTYELP